MSTIIPFGVLPGGEEVSLIRLKGNGAVQAEIITLGAIIKSLWVPDRKDDRKDVVLGQDSLEAYLNNQSCSAAVIGRVANRIGGASFSILKEKYQLEANDHVHCQDLGCNQRYWRWSSRGSYPYQSGKSQTVDQMVCIAMRSVMFNDVFSSCWCF